MGKIPRHREKGVYTIGGICPEDKPCKTRYGAVSGNMDPHLRMSRYMLGYLWCGECNVFLKPEQAIRPTKNRIKLRCPCCYGNLRRHAMHRNKNIEWRKHLDEKRY